MFLIQCVFIIAIFLKNEFCGRMLVGGFCMKCYYDDYKNVNIDEEVLKIINSDEINLMLFPNDKMCLFLLGTAWLSEPVHGF